jgi:hypothetical protein
MLAIGGYAGLIDKTIAIRDSGDLAYEASGAEVDAAGIEVRIRLDGLVG